MAKFKEGDIVKVLPLRECRKVAEFTGHMEKFCGKVAVVMGVFDELDCYQLGGIADDEISKGDWGDYTFTDDMLEEGD